MNNGKRDFGVFQNERLEVVRMDSFEKRLEDFFQPVLPEALVLIVGHTGSGKTAFLKCLIGDVARLDKDNPYYFRTLKHNVGILKSSSPPKSPIVLSRVKVIFILSAGVFKDKEVIFFEDMRRLGKMVVFVRTKVDNDLRGEQRSRPKTYEERKVLNEIKINCENNFSRTDVPEHVYLLDNNDDTKYDFPALLECLAKDLPLDIKESLKTESLSGKYSEAHGNCVNHAG